MPYDQWLITHFDPSWGIKQVKLWILAKCITSKIPEALDIVSPRHRPSSPITFAPHPSQRPISPIRFANPKFQRPRLSLQSVTDNWNDDDEDDDVIRSGRTEDNTDEDVDGQWDIDTESDQASNNTRWSNRRYHTPQPSTQKSGSTAPTPTSVHKPSFKQGPQLLTQYTLVRFSTGQILEDDFPLSWYAVRPYELLEVHRAGLILRLPREVPSEYIEPYFEAHVKFLRVMNGDGSIYAYNADVDEDKKGAWNQPNEDKVRDRDRDKEKGKKGKGKDKNGRGDSLVMVERGRSKKRKVEWKERWVVIRSGVLNLCKDENVCRSLSPSL